MAELKIKEISNYTDCGKNKTKVVFSDNKVHKNTEIIFEGSGKIKTIGSSSGFFLNKVKVIITFISF